jgi:hypothetical protein
MVWESKEITHLLDVTRINKDGSIYTDSEEYKLGDSRISVYISADDIELKIRPFVLEHLVCPIGIDRSSQAELELFAGIRDGLSIAYIGGHKKSTSHSSGSVSQYFFKDDKPSSFNFGSMRGPGWPLNLPPFADEKILAHLNELRILRSDASDSIWRCAALLSVPGPEYNGRSGEGIALRFPKYAKK